MKGFKYAWISLVMAALTGCATEGGDEEISEAEQNVCYIECYYAYYAEPARITLVGECEGIGGQLSCWGRKTSYRSGGCFQICEP